MESPSLPLEAPKASEDDDDSNDNDDDEDEDASSSSIDNVYLTLLPFVTCDKKGE